MQAVGGGCPGNIHSPDIHMITAIWKHTHGFPIGSLNGEGLGQVFLY